MSDHQWLKRSIAKINNETDEVIEIYASLTEAAKADNVTHKAIIGRIERKSVINGCRYVYLEPSKKLQSKT